jgi:phosphatidylserine decarboxylase
MKDGLIITGLSIVPRRLVSRLMGAFGRTRLPAFLLRPILRWYVGHYGVNLADCEGGIEDYDSLVAFFTRPLLPDARPICSDPDAVVSPVDGAVYAIGTIQGGRLPQAPELDYAVQDLLGGDDRYEGGEFAVIYLSPKDYHRVHTPREGTIRAWRYRPGELWPVFPAATRRVRDLFAKNERMVTLLETDAGELALVMVGAFGVGRMRTTYCDLISNTGEPAVDGAVVPPRPIERCGELGRFEMGSTVVLVFPAGRVSWSAAAGDAVRLGQRIGAVVA